MLPAEPAVGINKKKMSDFRSIDGLLDVVQQENIIKKLMKKIGANFLLISTVWQSNFPYSV
jgi:hypothetical protein